MARTRPFAAMAFCSVFAALYLQGCGPGDRADGGLTDAAMDGARDGADATASTDAANPTTLRAVFGTREAAFDRVQFGLTASEDGGAWTLYVEAHAGGDPACPTMTSPTPERTLIINGIDLPVDGSVRTLDDGLVVALFDYEGAVVDEPLVRATSVRFTPRMIDAMPPEALRERTIAFDLEADFPGGTIRGHGEGTWCASLDQ